jgi:hypothetical protein
MPLSDFWENYGNTTGFQEIECADAGTGSLAARVLNYYAIPNDVSSDVGGELPNLDIKHMDAMQVIKYSLLEHSADNDGVWEPMVNADGEVEFKKVGSYSSNIEGHIYHQIQTMDYKEEITGIMVQGGKPLITRKEVEWTPIWGDDASKQIYEMDLNESNCLYSQMSRHATIVFPDPHLDSSFEDGVDNLYEISAEEGNEYDSIVGWVYFKDPPPDLVTKDTEISYSSNSEIPIEIGLEGATGNGPYVGNLFDRPTYPANGLPECWVDLGVDVDDIKNNGIMVPIPEHLRFQSFRDTVVDTFINISSVLVVGRVITQLYSRTKSDDVSTSPAPTADDCDIWVAIDSSLETVFKLTEGEHYVVAYDTDEQGYKVPYVVFAKNSKINDPATYGNGKDGNGVVMNINRGCTHFIKTGHLSEIGTVLPMDQTSGIWVSRIFVTAQLNTPSVNIYDPNGADKRALRIAEGLDYLVSPIVIVDAPPPVAYNGTLIDMSQSKQDNDPTTAQDFSDTQYELALDEMNGGGLSLTLSFLEEEQCITLSRELYEYMNSLDGVETVYVCDPDCEPALGGIGPSGGTVNNVSYSYSDSGSYTVSVSEGPRLVGGFSDVSGGPTQKMAESVSAEGTIIQDMGNHIYFKVRIDGFGERIAINCCPSILRPGDRVSCSVHNNPVES